MSHLVGEYNAFHTAGAAKALTAAWVAGTVIQQPRPANTMRLRCTLAWTVAPTNARVRAGWFDGATFVPVSVVNSVAAGVVALADGIFDLPLGTAGTHEIVVSIPPGKDLRVDAYMVDPGAADPTLLARATLTDE